MSHPRPLSGATVSEVRPARITVAHLGLGAFHRAHQVWATEVANRRRHDDGEGPNRLDGYASFTGRRPDAANALAAQDGLYHLLVRHPDHTAAELVGSLVDAHDGADVAHLLDLVARPELGTVTLTVTEAGYRRDAEGGLDLDDAGVAADLRALRAGEDAGTTTAPGRLLAAVRARASAGLDPLALVSCDNLIDNGTTVQRVVADLADAVGGEAPRLVAATSFVHTMVDRITPHTTDTDRSDVAELTGYADTEPVPCEPFTEWVLAGDFPSGRPAWELSGARFVDDVKPFEQRKLWMLNATHSILAYVGALRGHATVADATADPACRDLITSWWNDAEAAIDLPHEEITSYADELIARYTNASVAHRLAQIAGDGSQKLPIRIAPVLLATRAAGGSCHAGVQALAAYVLHLRGHGVPVTDVAADAMVAAATGGDDRQAVTAVLGRLDRRLTDDATLVDDVTAAVDGLSTRTD